MTHRFLLLFLLSLNVFAEDCTPVNLITESDSPFQKMPVYNQGAFNICYAYSAAQILDWYQIKKGASKRNVHPVWVALQYALLKNRPELEIGHRKEAMESLRISLNCDYEAVEAAVRTLREPAELKEALQKVCPMEMRKFVMVPEVERVNFKTLNTDESFENFLNTKLSTSPSPLSIAYCSNVWKDQEFDGIEVNSRRERDVVKKNCEYHESLIVGQKRIGNSCHFLVRNTWGSKWTSFNSPYSCVCLDQATGEFLDDCRPETHRNSRFSVEACWIKGKDLARNIGQITFVK